MHLFMKIHKNIFYILRVRYSSKEKNCRGKVLSKNIVSMSTPSTSQRSYGRMIARTLA